MAEGRSGEINMPRQTRRTMAQRPMTCDWPLLHFVGICLAEQLSGRPLVEMPAGDKIRVTCHGDTLLGGVV